MVSSFHHWENLEEFVKAPSKQFVDQVFTRAFKVRLDAANLSEPGNTLVSSVASELDISEDKSGEVLLSVLFLIRKALSQDRNSIEDIDTVFPNDFHSNLRTLLTRIIAAHAEEWKAALIHSQVSLPRLVDFRWRIDVKSASHTVSRMAAPAVIVQMRVRDSGNMDSSQMQPEQQVNLELNKDTLNTMLDGLGKIRDQLSSI
eukprot:gb/GECH01014065.1/.p1 GENE.gb/GECH01014065.1/~~gb/GECH01014065.1/.p1  ORF type:complete len:202 (+),score=29.40 gb/GECH01014065.1/:1-606(+)